VCVRHSDVAVLRAAMRRLETHAPGGGGECQCVLVHEEEYGTAALYVHRSPFPCLPAARSEDPAPPPPRR